MNIWKTTKSVEGDSLVCVSLKKCGFPKITNLVSAHVIHNLPFRFPSNLTSKSFQFYSDLTSVPHRFLAGVTSVCFRLHFHLTSISFAIFNSREGCIPCLQIQMDDPRTAPETLQTNWVATENSHSSEKKTCLSQRHFTSPENHTTWRLSDSSGSQKIRLKHYSKYICTELVACAVFEINMDAQSPSDTKQYILPSSLTVSRSIFNTSCTRHNTPLPFWEPSDGQHRKWSQCDPN